MEQTPLSAADVAAVARNNSAFGGFGGFNAGYGMGMGYGAEWMWIVVLFALFGGGGFGWGNRGMGADMNGAFTRSDMQDGFNNQTIQNKLDGLGGQITNVNNGLCNGFYETTKNTLQGQNQLNRDLCQGFSAISSQVAENRFASQQCCCNIERSIDAVRYENAKNTCEIVRAIEKDGDETRKLIVANQIQDLRDKVAMQSQIIQNKDFALSQKDQNEYLVDKISPCPKPTYSVYPPFPTAVNGVYGLNGYNGYNYNNSCGCGCGNY